MPKKVKTRRQRKAAAAKKLASKEERKDQPEEKSCDLKSRVVIDENQAKPWSSWKKDEKDMKKETSTSCNKLVKKKGRHAWELGNALDKVDDEHSSDGSNKSYDTDELLDQIYKDFDLDQMTFNDKESDSNMVAEETKEALYRNGDSSTSSGLGGDPGQIPPMFFGDTDYTIIMPKKVKTKRQRKADAAKNPAKKEEPKNQPEEKSCNLESRVVIDENLAKHINPTLFASSSKKKENKDNEVETSKSYNKLVKKGRHAWELGNALDKIDDEHSSDGSNKSYDTDELVQMYKNFPSNDEENYSMNFDLDLGKVKGALSPNGDDLSPIVDSSHSAGLGGDPGPVPPKFFGKTGYFMLSGTNSQLAQQMKDLTQKNITVKSFFELSNDVADIVEQQMSDLVQNADQILQKMHSKNDLLAQRRVPRVKKQRKYPKKTNN